MAQHSTSIGSVYFVDGLERARPCCTQRKASIWLFYKCADAFGCAVTLKKERSDNGEKEVLVYTSSTSEKIPPFGSAGRDRDASEKAVDT